MGSGILEEDEVEFWRLFLGWSQGVHAAVNHAVIEGADLSVSEFELMTRLWSHPGHELPQHDLTVDLGWSHSRGSHLLRRLEGRGFVERHDLGHGRARNVRLTAQGLDRLMGAFEVHGQAFRDALLDRLTPAQRRVLQEVMQAPASPDPSPASPDEP